MTPDVTKATTAPNADLGVQGPERSTPVTLYMHAIGYADMPINTQRPEGNDTGSSRTGMTSATTTCIPAIPSQGVVGQEFHSYYGYSSASFVEYNFLENGLPRVHPERGLAYDVRLDTKVPWMFHWYVTTRATPPFMAGPVPLPANPNSAPLVIPNVVVRATVRTGDGVSLSPESYNSGDILAQGQSGPVTLAGPETAQLNPDAQGFEGWSQAKDGSQVYGFSFPLETSATSIPKTTGYNVRVDVWMDNPACDDPTTGTLAPSELDRYSDADHLPRMELAIHNPLRFEYLHPQFVTGPDGDEVAFHVEASSPWGAYDVDAQDVQFNVTDPDGHQVEGVQRIFVHTYYAHQPHRYRIPVDATFVWNYTGGKKPGDYRIAVVMTNLQHTARAYANASFDPTTLELQRCSLVNGTQECVTILQHGGIQDAPGVPVPFLGATLVGAAVALRTKRRKQG